MGRGQPQGAGIFGAFLAAQQTSPTLSLGNAGLGDEGALEIAHFLAESRHLIRLDLTGNNLSSTAVFHLAKAIKQNHTLESLSLKHNRIGDLGEAGLATLCRALHGNETLRHLDLRHAGLTGAMAASVLGEMLSSNSHLTHLELSWNPLDPAGGQALLEQMRVNTTLFDCQLTGCGIANETLFSIAQILLRNRKAKGADLQAGPYQAVVDWSGGGRALPGADVGGPLTRSQLVDCSGGDGVATMAGGAGDGTNVDIAARAAHSDVLFSSFVVSNESTNELMMRLAKFIGSPGTTQKDAALAQEMYEYLDRAQKQLIQDRDQVEGIHRHLTALSEGFRDREIRSREKMGVGHNELLELKQEILTIRGILERRSEELGLIRDQNSQTHRDHVEDREQGEADEALNKNRLAEIMAEKRELEKRLASLQEACQKQDAENAELRKRTARLREGVTLLHLPGQAGPFPE